jgi:hypothetical protein
LRIAQRTSRQQIEEPLHLKVLQRCHLAVPKFAPSSLVCGVCQDKLSFGNVGYAR